MTKLYLSASVINAPLNLAVATTLESLGARILLPQKIIPTHTGRQRLEKAVYSQCLEMMEEADGAVLLLDCYGRDSAWEAGWFQGVGKPVIGWLEASLRFLQDWMVKYSLDAVLTPNDGVHKILQSSDLIGNLPTFLVDTSTDLQRLLKNLDWD